VGKIMVEMKPIGCSLHTKVPSLPRDMVSFEAPTFPCQTPTILVE